jgi:hypothetical protein
MHAFAKVWQLYVPDFAEPHCFSFSLRARLYSGLGQMFESFFTRPGAHGSQLDGHPKQRTSECNDAESVVLSRVAREQGGNEYAISV